MGTFALIVIILLSLCRPQTTFISTDLPGAEEIVFVGEAALDDEINVSFKAEGYPADDVDT